ncbi:MAG TPA: hypothetical protein VG674_28235 [Amycolatopsis sp.]|nr:hypothetical protein [Amycolatopsis sp.]
MIRQISVALSAAGVAVAAVGCSAEEPAAAPAPVRSAAATPTSSQKSQAPQETAPTSTAAHTADDNGNDYAPPDAYAPIAVRDGKVLVGQPTVGVKRGGVVLVKLLSDRTDKLHVSGYEITKDVQAGKPLTFSFKADTPGKFEAELTQSRLKLFTLQVS